MDKNLALGIAKAQKALDENSVQTAEALANQTIEVIPQVTEEITDKEVKFKPAEKIKMSLLQVGLNPTFYQFSESTIEVGMDIKTSTTTETSVNVSLEAKVGFSVWSASIKADVAFNRKFGQEVHGTSKMVVKLVPVAPPQYLMPKLEVVDLRTPPKPAKEKEEK